MRQALVSLGATTSVVAVVLGVAWAAGRSDHTAHLGATTAPTPALATTVVGRAEALDPTSKRIRVVKPRGPIAPVPMTRAYPTQTVAVDERAMVDRTPPPRATDQTTTAAVRFTAEAIAWYVAQPRSDREGAAASLAAGGDAMSLLTFAAAVKGGWTFFTFADGYYRVRAVSGDAKAPHAVMLEVVGHGVRADGSREQFGFGGVVSYQRGSWPSASVAGWGRLVRR
jgi:hypothetical protein